MVRGAWCVVRGAWCVVRGAWCVAVGAVQIGGASFALLCDIPSDLPQGRA
ncbi:hypothetical protein [Acetobacter persici]|nr:hypothetical protein [Acetobacter persici]